MTKAEFLSLASNLWEDLESKKSGSASFHEYEKALDELLVNFGRSTLEGTLGKASKDRRKKSPFESLRANRDK